MPFHEDADRLNWDDRADNHATDLSGPYPVSRAISGGSSLNPIETKEIGDISGMDIVHLQCHIGLDTISLKNLAAKVSCWPATGRPFRNSRTDSRNFHFPFPLAPRRSSAMRCCLKTRCPAELIELADEPPRKHFRGWETIPS